MIGRRASSPARLVALARAEFPDDETMAELHILRAILAVERGNASLEEILRQEVPGCQRIRGGPRCR